MADKAAYLLLTGIIIACAPIKLTHEITNRQSIKLYHEAVRDPEQYFLEYSHDSAYVICILNDSSQLISQPLSFIVVNLSDKEKVFVSIKEYHKAQWLDNNNIRLVKYMGIANFDRSFDRKATKNRIEFNLNVISGELIQIEDTQNELF